MSKVLKKRRANKEGDIYDLTYKWLTKKEIGILSKGGYFDNEGLLRDNKGCVRCTSVVRSTGKRCKNFAISGETYCKFHGGTLARTKAGKGRMYSAFIQDSTIKGIYESSQENSQVTGIQEELGILRGLLGKLLQNSANYDIKETKQLASVIGEIRQLVSECTKAEIKLGKLIEISAVQSILKRAVAIIAKYVTDKDILEKIANECSNIAVPTAGTTVQQSE